jgi:hypothetical protein
MIFSVFLWHPLILLEPPFLGTSWCSFYTTITELKPYSDQLFERKTKWQWQ